MVSETRPSTPVPSARDESAGQGPAAPGTGVPRQHRAHLPEDARRHPREAGLAAVVLVLGVVAVVCGLVTGWHFVGSVAGTLGVALGLWDQYLSATRAERMVIIPGLVAAGLGLGLSLAHGGFGV